MFTTDPRSSFATAAISRHPTIAGSFVRLPRFADVPSRWNSQWHSRAHARLFEMFRPFMPEFARLDRLFGGSIAVASDTFVHQVAQHEWVAVNRHRVV
jgi:hypothetical protein